MPRARLSCLGGERRHEPLMKSKFRRRDLLCEVRASSRAIRGIPAMERDALRLRRFTRRVA
jgi:hypothetical protein